MCDESHNLSFGFGVKGRLSVRLRGAQIALLGFTLIELAAVVFLIGIILALGLPRLIPAIAYSELEGAARHLAGYGRALMAYCALTHSDVTFHVDLTTGEYWSTRWVYDVEESKGADRRGEASNIDVRGVDVMNDMAWKAQDMARRFEKFVRLSLEARSRLVEKKSEFDTGPLFEKQFDLEWDSSLSQEEIKTDLLARTRLPVGVRFTSVRIGTMEYREGVAETEINALGLTQTVEFGLESGGEQFVVKWDAITGGFHILRGTEAR